MGFRFKAFALHLARECERVDADARSSVSRLVPLARMVFGGYANRARDHDRRRRRPRTATDLHRRAPCQAARGAGPGRGSNLARATGSFRLWRHDPLARPADLLRVLRELPLGRSGTRYRAGLSRFGCSEFALAPHWYSLPRWIWAPLPDNYDEANNIVRSAIQGGFDVTARPAYYKPWASGAAELRSQLKRVDEIKFFSMKERGLLKQRMTALGLAPDQADAIPLTGRKRPLLAVFDPSNLRLLTYIKPN